MQLWICGYWAGRLMANDLGSDLECNCQRKANALVVVAVYLLCVGIYCSVINRGRF